MSLIDLLREYADEKIDAISTIRRISGMFEPQYAVDLLTIICAITRVEQGDLDRATFRKVWLRE